MSTDNQQPSETISEQTDGDAAQLREINDALDQVARANGGAVDGVLRDVQHVLETTACVLEHEDGDITREEFRERVYPTRGGQR